MLLRRVGLVWAVAGLVALSGGVSTEAGIIGFANNVATITFDDSGAGGGLHIVGGGVGDFPQDPGLLSLNVTDINSGNTGISQTNFDFDYLNYLIQVPGLSVLSHAAGTVGQSLLTVSWDIDFLMDANGFPASPTFAAYRIFGDLGPGQTAQVTAELNFTSAALGALPTADLALNSGVLAGSFNFFLLDNGVLPGLPAFDTLSLSGFLEFELNSTIPVAAAGIQANQVPEPGTWALLGIVGLGGTVVARRRIRKAAA